VDGVHGQWGPSEQHCTQSEAGAAITVPADLIFTSDAACATPLSWEFESYSAANGAAAIWVRVPTLSHTSDTSDLGLRGKGSGDDLAGQRQ